ncbi:MAG: sugar ABC transporter ATP-binding protein [Pleurocapsa minor GSE-CHR-MK-17-07R]|jgi:ribose transport system ATP-binding protein|nr:sugar ABC transporter ATP-binding protein [Pleurocapsa minor GSE-CHR-MK 17-07R]
MSTPFFRVENISKSFPGVKALAGVSFDVAAGEVHALVGENGAGKSTLMKIMSGVYQPDEGQLLWEGQPIMLRTPHEAQARGIRIIYQEFNLLPDLTVAENILLNREPRNRWGLIDWRAMNQQAAAILALLKTNISPTLPASELTVAQQQLVEIAKSLAEDARLIIMDEPTAALNALEVEHLFGVIERLKTAGAGIIFISHRLEEVLHISDRVTVLKDGCLVGTHPTSALTKPQIVTLMVGRDLKDIFPAKHYPTHKTPLLEVRQLQSGVLHDISFQILPGEIVGFAGLEGQGQRELARSLFGLEPVRSGTIAVNGTAVRIQSPRQAIRAGIALVSDDRKRDGLALKLSVRENIALPNLPMLTRGGFVGARAERSAAQRMIDALNIRTPSAEQSVRLLSGGNQQKAVLGKWMVQPPSLMVIQEPTRGVDIGAKMEIYHLVYQMARDGMGILIVSSELLELIGLCHRILVMHRGTIAAEFPGDEATEESIMQVATGTDVPLASGETKTI